MNLFQRLLSVLLAGFLLSGCMLFSEAVQPALPPPDAYTETNPQTTVSLEAPINESDFEPAAASPSPDETKVPVVQLPTPNAIASPTTSVPTLRQLTDHGCCVNPYFSADSQRVLFIDRPSADKPAGIWGVSVLGGSPEFISDQLGIYSDDQTMRAFPASGQTIVEQLSDGQRWVIPNGGRSIAFSPDHAFVAWTAGQAQQQFDSAMRRIWISRFDGSLAQPVAAFLSAGVSGWFPDGRLLVSGRLGSEASGQAIWILTPGASGEGDWQAAEIARAERLRGALISPGGGWLAYLSTFSSDPEQDGLWLLNTLTLEKRRLDVFGAYRWRDSTHLLVVPLQMESVVHQLLQVEVETGTSEALTDPASLQFKISNGDWTVSPDGRYIAFVSAIDHNIWLIDLGQN